MMTVALAWLERWGRFYLGVENQLQPGTPLSRPT